MRDEDKSQQQLVKELREARRFQSIAGAEGMGVVIFDLSGICRYVNPYLANLAATTPESMVGSQVGEVLVPPAFHKGGGGGIVATLRALQREEISLQRRDGHSVPVLASAVDISDDHGQLSSIGLVVINIVRQKEAENLLATSLETLQASRDNVLSIVNQLRSVTMIVDRDFDIIFLSESGLKLLKKAENAVVGMPCFDIFPIPQKDRVKIKLSASMDPARRNRIPVQLEVAPGRVYWMDIDVRNDPADNNRYILFFYDTTEVHGLRQQLDTESGFHQFKGRSEKMELLYKQIREVASVDWTVLIEGETGSGKELAARAIHDSSGRRRAPFVPVNCAGLTDSLLGSQLFGHKRGSFTGAVSDQKGVFESANGGTVFLDEIGDISSAVQTNLLRVLETREVTRIGEATPRKVDVRIIAATNRDLAEAVQSGEFRTDLLYRIRAARITLPPLRDRQSDIPLLASEFLRTSAAAAGKTLEAISGEAMKLLLAHPWPGNVRELKGALEFAALHSGGPLIDTGDLPPELSEGSPGAGRIPAGAPGERERFLNALEQTNGNRTVAARLLGMSRATFYRRLDRLGIQV